MEIILMDKNIPVIEIDVNKDFGRIKQITKEINMEYLPIIVPNSLYKEGALQHWM